MKKEQVILLSQLLGQMQILVQKLDDSIKKNDSESVLKIKKDFYNLQKRIGDLL